MISEISAITVAGVLWRCLPADRFQIFRIVRDACQRRAPRDFAACLLGDDFSAWRSIIESKIISSVDAISPRRAITRAISVTFSRHTRGSGPRFAYRVVYHGHYRVKVIIFVSATGYPALRDD